MSILINKSLLERYYRKETGKDIPPKIERPTPKEKQRQEEYVEWLEGFASELFELQEFYRNLVTRKKKEL